MYIDLILLIILILVVVMFFKRFSSFVFLIAIMDLLFRLFTFLRVHITFLPDVAAIIKKYIPNSMSALIDKYTSGLFNTILQWALWIIMFCFLTYIIKIFIKKKKI